MICIYIYGNAVCLTRIKYLLKRKKNKMDRVYYQVMTKCNLAIHGSFMLNSQVIKKKKKLNK